MTKIDFYILPHDSCEQRHLFACRLAEKAFKLGNEIYVHSSDSAQAKTLDQLLWSWKNTSFIPHQIDDAAIVEQQVHIGYGEDKQMSGDHNGLLINLSDHVPEFFSRFERVSEIVVQDAEVTESTRANYRFYRNRGYHLDTHDLRRK